MISAERKCCVVWKSFYCFFLQFNTSLLGQKVCGIYSCKWYKEEIMDSVLTVVSCFNATFCILQNDSSLEWWIIWRKYNVSAFLQCIQLFYVWLMYFMTVTLGLMSDESPNDSSFIAVIFLNFLISFWSIYINPF